MRRYVFLACLAGIVVSAVPASAREGRDRTWFGTLYIGQWTTDRLTAIPGELVTADLATLDSYYASAILTRALVRDVQTDIPVLRRMLNGSSVELEGQLGTHFNIQDNLEATIALVWRSPQTPLPWTETQLNFALGEGLSYAFGTPRLEYQATVPEPRRLLNYLMFELEFSHPSLPGVSLVLPRIHHRSSIFGLLGPVDSGSNIVGVGLRFRLN
jgi:hypothetical protein